MNNTLESDIIVIDSSNYCNVTTFDDNLLYSEAYISRLLGNILETVNVMGEKRILNSSKETHDLSIKTMEVSHYKDLYIPKTELGKKLLKLRKEIESEGRANLSYEDIEKEIKERRGGISYEDFWC